MSAFLESIFHLNCLVNALTSLQEIQTVYLVNVKGSWHQMKNQEKLLEERGLKCCSILGKIHSQKTPQVLSLEVSYTMEMMGWISRVRILGMW